MTTPGCKITLHMVSSLDGMIAKKDNSISWFETSNVYEKGVAGEDPEILLNAIDCYVMGSKTYEHAVALSAQYGWAYGNKPTIVLTHRYLVANGPNIEFYAGDLHTLVTERLKPSYKNVWVAGGSLLAKALIRLKLVDEIRVSILPIILGEGLLFFDQIGQEQNLQLTDTIAYKTGMVELCYRVIR
jgi:dihydrofolate reductase